MKRISVLIAVAGLFLIRAVFIHAEDAGMGTVTFAAANQFKEKGWPISTGIVRRPWGSRDFRVLAPEGYYFRFTEGH